MSHISFLWYPGAFVVALGILIVVHELGHYVVARWLGVKVLRFSVGFGKPLLMRRFGPDQTEWVLAAFPLGGYVKMLDEREAPVPADERSRAFNRFSVGRRALIVVAGPVANLLLAILINWLLFISGVTEPRPLLGAPPVGTPAAQAGVEAGDEVRQVSGVAVATAHDFSWQLMQRLVDGETVKLVVLTRRGDIKLRNIPTAGIDRSLINADALDKLGIVPYQPPELKPLIGMVVDDSAAQSAGLQTGDLIQTVDGTPVTTWNELTRAIRQSPAKPVALGLDRNGALMSLTVVPQAVEESGQTIGRIGIGIGSQLEVSQRMMIKVRLAPGVALARAGTQTWDMAIFSLRMVGRILTGEQSWRNISGVVTIASYAGQSAQLGLEPYLKFLALISISLGVLNLLPIPILDGGHLLYYLLEVVKGSPLSERAMEIGQQAGFALLVLLMAFALFNDIHRLVSG
jgi:regulator of sigma E protease